jgi:thioredoxin 1
MIHIIDNDHTDFNALIKQDKITLVDFWADWCKPCKILAPIIEQLSEDMGETINIIKVDVDANPNISKEFGIKNIPTCLIFKEGEVIDKTVGAVPLTHFKEKINKHLTKN